MHFYCLVTKAKLSCSITTPFSYKQQQSPDTKSTDVDRYVLLVAIIHSIVRCQCWLIASYSVHEILALSACYVIMGGEPPYINNLVGYF